MTIEMSQDWIWIAGAVSVVGFWLTLSRIKR
mgnify:CR=1 FL=1